MRNEYRVGKQNINAIPLVNRSNILIPPLHIKLCLFNYFVKALGSDSPAVERLHVLFPQLSQSKIKAGVFNGRDIRKLSNDHMF